MLRNAVRIGSAFAMLSLIVVLVPAQGPKGKEGQASQAVRAKSVLGAKVSIQGDTAVGTVDDIVLTDEGVVDYLIVSEGGKLVTVPWDAVKFQYDKRIVTINIAQDQFRQIPTYTAEQYPSFYTPTYRTQIYKYYGLTPGQERRLERRLERKP